jgi:hypothetical protein
VFRDMALSFWGPALCADPVAGVWVAWRDTLSRLSVAHILSPDAEPQVWSLPFNLGFVDYQLDLANS